MNLKSVIPFTKDLDFSTKISEITSISLERDFEVLEGVIEGNLYVTGEYKSHEISANVLPFSYKIPFTIEIPENLEEKSISLEICDFAYDIPEEEKINVKIELELCGELVQTEEENTIDVDSDELLAMLEEKNEIEEERVEEISEVREENYEEVETENIKLQEETEDIVMDNINSFDEEDYKTYHIHIVKEGENIETICTFYNSNLNILGEYNDLNQVNVGDKLLIPETDE